MKIRNTKTDKIKNSIPNKIENTTNANKKTKY